MKRKDYKLLVEGWRKIVSESSGFDSEDDLIDISSDSLDFDSMISDEETPLEEFSDESEASRKIEDNEDEIKRFCRLMDINCNDFKKGLKYTLLNQAATGDLEGNQFDEFGNKIDFDELDEQ